MLVDFRVLIHIVHVVHEAEKTSILHSYVKVSDVFVLEYTLSLVDLVV